MGLIIQPVVIRRAAMVLNALDNDDRRLIASILMEREMSVTAIQQHLEISQGYASRNLRILFEAGLVTRERVPGKRGFKPQMYSIRLDRLDLVYKSALGLSSLPPLETITPP